MNLLRKITLIIVVLVVFAASVLITILPSLYENELNKVLPSSGAPSNQALELHKTLDVCDLHADSLLWDRNLNKKTVRGHVDIPRLIEGNVAIQTFSIVTKVPKGLNIHSNDANSDEVTLLAMIQIWPVDTWIGLKPRLLYQANKLHKFARGSKGKFSVIESVKDLESYLQSRKSNPEQTAGILAVEGSHALEGNLDNIDLFFDNGIRMMAPTHFFDNELGGSAHGIKKNGLTEFGKNCIKKMQEKSIIVDLAHASHAVIRDVLKISKKPVLVSHTGVKGTCNNQRNLTDAEIRGVASTGGLIGIGYWSTAVCGSDVPSIAKAIKYTAKIAGVEHVALGSDFDGAVTVPFDTSKLVLVTDALLKQGFNEKEIRLIMGENYINLLRKELPSEPKQE